MCLRRARAGDAERITRFGQTPYSVAPAFEPGAAVRPAPSPYPYPAARLHRHAGKAAAFPKCPREPAAGQGGPSLHLVFGLPGPARSAM